MKANTIYLRPAAILGCLAIAHLLSSTTFASDRFEDDPILYSQSKASNAVSRLQHQLQTGETTLAYDKNSGYLPALLDFLDISPSSQVLVFSKTSLQNRYISPQTPRAIYFNDDHYIGTVQHGDVLEISVSDPQLGAVFYTLGQHERAAPRLTRQTDNCLQCHASGLTRGTPGHIVRSVFPDAEGFPVLRAGTHRTFQSSPLKERWGGWYVSGTHGNQRHMGNVIASETEQNVEIDRSKGANIKDLSTLFNTRPYLTPHSDIVALMLLEHQAQMHNLITRANHGTQLALYDMDVINTLLKRPEDVLTPSAQRRIDSIAYKLVDHMLFVNEEPITELITGTSGFTEEFSRKGPHDSAGRSLRELDLESRLFKYPCSYLIYSDSFDALPEPVLESIYRRLYDILTGKVSDDAYLNLSNGTCKNILTILRETKPNLPDYWMPKK